MDSRFELLKQYISTIFDKKFTLKKASDDASFRRYFRIFIDNKTYIAMDAPPEKEKIDNFISIAKFLIKNNINAPKIYHINLNLGFLILQDFGNITLLQKPDKKFYKLAIDELIKIQTIKTTQFKPYNKELLLTEMQLCLDWFNNDFDYNTVFDFLTSNIKEHQQVLVHRDYHSRNIMLDNKKLGIIDFQDAVFGSYAYDLASLLKDAYIELDSADELLLYYFQKSKLADYKKLVFDFDMIATQRHIKILGIFKRLSIRDNKDEYLKNIPLIIKYLTAMSKKYPQLKELEKLCKH